MIFNYIIIFFIFFSTVPSYLFYIIDHKILNHTNLGYNDHLGVLDENEESEIYFEPLNSSVEVDVKQLSIDFKPKLVIEPSSYEQKLNFLNIKIIDIKNMNQFFNAILILCLIILIGLFVYLLVSLSVTNSNRKKLTEERIKELKNYIRIHKKNTHGFI